MNEDELGSTPEERECYVQGVRAGIQMFRNCLPDLYAAGYSELASGLSKLAQIADRKVEEWADSARLP